MAKLPAKSDSKEFAIEFEFASILEQLSEKERAELFHMLKGNLIPDWGNTEQRKVIKDE